MSLLRQIPKEISKALRPSYHVPFEELTEKAEELMDFAPKKEEEEKSMTSINESETKHRKEIVKKKIQSFWISRPGTWFRLVEDHEEKFEHFVGSLETKVSSEAEEIIKKPPRTKK